MNNLRIILFFVVFTFFVSLYLLNHDAFASTGTKLYLDAPPSVLYVGQTVTFSGTLVTANGSPLQGATIYIKDDDTFGPDDLITKGPTNSYGEFRISVTVKNWDEFSGASDIYAVFENSGGFERSRSSTFEVNVYEKTQQKPQNSYSSGSSGYGSGYIKPKSSTTQSSYAHYPTKITLDPIPTSVYAGQKVTFSGKLTSNGQPLQNAEIKIKDEDFADFDDTLMTAITDSKGKFSKSWNVREVDSSDRKGAAFLLRFVDPTFSIAPTVNGLVNAMEVDTVEIYAEFSGSSSYQKSNTCSVQYSSGSTYTSCTNNALVIRGSDNSIEDRIVSAALGEIIPGGGVITQNSDVLYSILSSGEISERDLSQILTNALVDELGVNSADYSIEEMIAMLEEDRALLKQKTYQSSKYETTTSVRLNTSQFSKETQYIYQDGDRQCNTVTVIANTLNGYHPVPRGKVVLEMEGYELKSNGILGKLLMSGTDVLTLDSTGKLYDCWTAKAKSARTFYVTQYDFLGDDKYESSSVRSGYTVIR